MKNVVNKLVLVLIVLAAVTTMVETASAYCSPGNPFPCGTSINIKVTTDKYMYSQGALVTFMVKNTGTANVWINPNPVTVKDVRGNIVYDPSVNTCSGDVCTMSSVVPSQVELKAGGTYKWTWDQKMNTGYACAYDEWECAPPSVSSGWYQGSVQVYGNDGIAYYKTYKTNLFVIR